MNKNLSNSKIGQIVSVHHEVEGESFFSLLSLGILPGDKIEVVSKAPFNGPITCRHHGNTLFALRRDEASKISVTPV